MTKRKEVKKKERGDSLNGKFDDEPRDNIILTKMNE